MSSALVFLAFLGLAAANPLSVFGVARLHDDGQWKPAFDGSWLGSGHLSWMGHDDGQWKPHMDNSAAGLVHRIYRRQVYLSPTTYSGDNLHVAAAKQAHLIQQHTEATRNILGGGIPLHLPADTPEVALGKQAHAIAHENQKAITSGHLPLVSGIHGYSALHHPLAYSGVHVL